MRFIVYDLEATCWMGRPPGGISEVIEVGAVMINEGGEEISSFNKFIRPLINPTLSSFCKKLTSITQEDVDIADQFPEVMEQFRAWIDIDNEDYVLGSWGKFDRDVLSVNSKLHKLEDEWIVDHYINLRTQYKALRNNPKQIGLKNTLEREGFEFTGVHHRAISDAENLGKIFSKFIDDWKY